MDFHQTVTRYMQIIPRRSISWKRFLAELHDCTVAKRRATIAEKRRRAEPTLPLNKWEQLYLEQQQHPELFPSVSYSNLKSPKFEKMKIRKIE